MSISFLAAAAGTAAALIGAALLFRLCLRTPRLDMLAWIVAAAGLAVGLAAQAAGYHRGFGPATFRAAQLGAALVAPLALCLGMAELAAKGLATRFTARLCLAGLFAVAAVILATDVLSGQAFSTAWPAARMHFEFLPLGLLALVAVAIGISIAGALSAVGLRARRDPRWRPARLPVAVAAVGALATQGLLLHLPVNAGYALLCLAAVVAAWLAGHWSARLPLAALRGAPAPGQAEAAEWAPQRTGQGGYQEDDSLGLYSGGYPRYEDTGGYSAYPGGGYGEYPGTGDFAGYPDAGHPGAAPGAAPEPVTGAFDALYREKGSVPAAPRGDPPAPPSPDSGVEPATGMQLAALEDAAAEPAAPPDPRLDTERLYGQIAIYTLLEAGAAEFDRLAGQVLDQVRLGEPGTLVYVVHGVPSAPLQRILYQVYRDRAAYDEHQRQPYVMDFGARLRPLVLATNVIELGVREAKVSALAPQVGRVP